jgi:hypothetical protein
VAAAEDPEGAWSLKRRRHQLNLKSRVNLIRINIFANYLQQIGDFSCKQMLGSLFSAIFAQVFAEYGDFLENQCSDPLLLNKWLKVKSVWDKIFPN